MDPSTLAAGNAERDSAARNEDASRLLGAGAAAQRRSSGDQYRGDRAHLPAHALLLAGLGCASVSRNGEPVIELLGLDGEHAMTVADAERLALDDPAQEWCIHMVSLLDDRHYRREGAGVWKLYARGYGLS